MEIEGQDEDENIENYKKLKYKDEIIMVYFQLETSRHRKQVERRSGFPS